MTLTQAPKVTAEQAAYNQRAAEIIRSRFGEQALYMIKAKYMAYSSERVQFAFRFGMSKQANFVSITVKNDLYQLEFGKVRGLDYKVVKTFEDVTVESLRETFSQFTQLYLNLF